ncbi:hypothetical protein C483_18823 [Natrialba hulunbeirensis JCM 10989]|uniref:Rubrerythrin-like domain-containing protein n=2 Tax=Natrialba TaxID=63742 RepID=M0AM94_9EURY|nr:MULTISPECIES: rubrerythrin-like domain-containing protein [Natrialba]ELY87372.1 hypothetical protein C483_18823 [Natrialba hulunbeirensis JCM 10989]ELY99012.1 hypothetical protein C482_10661 [Natrialba chahannaoensis JCM 10990]
MVLAEPLEYVCVQCRRHEAVDDALVSTCRQCGGEMRNVELVTD